MLYTNNTGQVPSFGLKSLITQCLFVVVGFKGFGLKVVPKSFTASLRYAATHLPRRGLGVTGNVRATEPCSVTPSHH